MSIQVTVVYSPRPREVHQIALRLAPNSTVIQALQASGFLERIPLIDQSGRVGVWGQQSGLQQTLQENDRVEIYRPLGVDPKVARRERFAQQGARSAGLFVKNRGGPR